MKAALAGVLAAMGVAVVVTLFLVQRIPEPLWLWGALSVAFVALEFWSVEVNDRLFVSSSIMVVFAAAVVFGQDRAVLAAAVMAAFAVLHPDDVRLRRWHQPAVNLGQLVISASVGTAVLLPFLPGDAVTTGDLPRIALGAILAAVAYDWVNFRLVSLIVRRLYPDRVLLPWSKMFPTHVALAALGALGALLGAAYVIVGAVVLPLMLVMFLVGHVGFASYSQLREAHESTVRGLVKAIEAMDPYSKGHTERVVRFSRMTGEALGFGADRLERLRWATLIHDIGKLAVPPELLDAPGQVAADRQERILRHARAIEEVLGEVDFLAPMVEIVSEGHLVGAEDGSLEARILAAADAFDALTSARSYRSAVTQDAAFSVLQRRSDVYGTGVVEALIAAITERGEVYGSPEEGSSAEVARLVKERAIRA